MTSKSLNQGQLVLFVKSPHIQQYFLQRAPLLEAAEERLGAAAGAAEAVGEEAEDLEELVD